MADRRLAVWTLASFHTAGFTLVFVAISYASGGLSDVLPEFGTVPGVVGYAYLWVLSYFATRWALTGDVLAGTLDGGLRDPLLRGSAAGGLVGLGTLLGPLLLVTLPDFVTGGGNLTAFLFILAIGSGIAIVVGVAIGFVFAVLDVAALRLSGSVVE